MGIPESEGTTMDYKGVEFEIVQTSNPCCWKWTAFLDASRMRSGVALTRADAVLDAELVIEAALELQEQSIKMGRELRSNPRDSKRGPEL
jgi:hypothetical protein